MHSLPPMRHPIVGRDREQTQLRRILDAAIDGHGSLVLVSGEAGIGKTTLVEDLVQHAKEQGCLVLTGGCYDLTTTPPYGPWIEILREYPAQDGLPALPEQLREGTSLEGIHSQAALFEFASRFFQDVANTQPVILLLEDLHWADVGSLELLRFLGRGIASHRILLVATYREDELTRRDPLFQLIPILARESAATRVELRGWTTDTVRAYLALQYDFVDEDEDADRIARYLAERAASNPLFVVELLHTLESESVLEFTPQGWQVGDLAGVPVPTFVVQLIEGRLKHLDERARQLLEIAAIIGQEIPLDIWKQVSRSSDVELSVALEGAIAAGILEEVPGGLRVRFRHALIREALYGEVGIIQRRDWHRMAAEALLATPRPDPDAVVTHLRPASDPRLLDWLVRSGDRATSRFAWDTAVERYTQASALIELQEAGDPVRTCQVLLKLGEAQNHAGAGRGRKIGAGNDPDAMATFWKVADIAREAGLGEHLGEAAHGIAGVNYAAMHGGPEGFRLLAEALVTIPDTDSQLRVRLLARIATGAVVLSTSKGNIDIATVEQVDAWSTEAVAMARRLGDPSTLAYALHCQATATFGLYALENRRASAEEVIALATHTNELPLVAWALYYWVIDSLVAGNFDSAHELFTRFVATAEQLHMPIFDWFAAAHRSAALLSIGRYEDAERAIEEVDAVWPGSIVAVTQRAALYRELDNHQALKEAMVPTSFGALSVTLYLRYLIEVGELDAANDQFRSFVDSRYLFQELPKRSFAWLRCAAITAEACARLGDSRRAELLYEHLAPFDGLNIFAGNAQYLMGSVSHYLGLLSTTMSDWDTAEHHFTRARDQNDCWKLRPAAAYTRYEWGSMLRQRDLTGDRERARELLNEALATARALRMIRLTRLTTALSADLGISDQPHPAGLSDREVEVLEQAATGMTNAEIGDALYISPRTVAQHLRSVYNKLGVNSRAAAVARWAERNRS